jgi:RND family efflux transporter MFP subunit
MSDKRKAGHPACIRMLSSLVLGVASAVSATAAEEARGLVRSLGEATISSEISARILSMPFREGEVFKSGDVLVSFDCEAMKANLAGAKAELRAADVALESAREMARMKAAGQRDVETAEARRDRAAADMDATAVRVKGCEVRAPFSGAVVDRNANPHEVIAPSTPLLRIVDRERLEIELLVSSSALPSLQPGTAFIFRIDETGETYPARIVRLGAAIEPASQTVKVFGAFDGTSAGVLQGMSGTAILPDPKARP